MKEKAHYIQIEKLIYHYPDGTVALNGIDLSINEDDFIALIGQNGSGKTTLSKCLNGLFKPTKGSVIVDGLNTRTTSITQMAVRVGYVFQNPDHQLFNNNVFDEIAYGPRNIQLPEEEVRARVDEAVNVVGLEDTYLKQHPFFLTKGLRQRVAIASILALRPKVIIVDEPTTGQDFKQSLEIMDFLKNLHYKHGHIIIIITHDMSIVARYTNRTLVMGMGQMIADGPTKDVFAQPEMLAETFLEPPQITQLAQACSDLGFNKDILTVKEMVARFKELIS